LCCFINKSLYWLYRPTLLSHPISCRLPTNAPLGQVGPHFDADPTAWSLAPILVMQRTAIVWGVFVWSATPPGQECGQLLDDRLVVATVDVVEQTVPCHFYLCTNTFILFIISQRKYIKINANNKLYSLYITCETIWTSIRRITSPKQCLFTEYLSTAWLFTEYHQ